MEFKYRGKKSDTGEFVDGAREAPDKFQLLKTLRAEGIDVVYIKPISGGVFTVAKINSFLTRIKEKDKIFFVKNLGAMLEAGLPISKALAVLGEQTGNLKLRGIIKKIDEGVASGKSLSSGFGNFPKVFSDILTAMVAAGEESGTLSSSLKIVGEQMDKSYQLKKKIMGAMIYPGIILSVMVIIGVLMMIFIVPNLTKTFAELKVDLPLSTRVVVSISNFLVNYTSVGITIILALWLIVWRAAKTKNGKRFFDFVSLNLPMIKGLVKEVNAAKTTRTLSSLIAGGVSLVEALKITEKVVSNSFYQEAIKRSGDSVERGEPLSTIFNQHKKLFPVLVGEMAEVGEETGKLSEMLLNAAVFYEDEIDSKTKNMSTIIEPFLMVLIGTFVGFFAISMIQPIYSISTNI